MVTEEQLLNNNLYWVRYDDEWRVGRYDEKYKQFYFIGRTIYGLSSIIEIDYDPIKRITNEKND